MLTQSLRRALCSSSMSACLYIVVVVVEWIGQEPSASVLKALAVAVLLAVAVGPLAGAAVTLVCVPTDSRSGHGRRQALCAVALALGMIVWSFIWVRWLLEPSGNPPAVIVE